MRLLPLLLLTSLSAAAPVSYDDASGSGPDDDFAESKRNFVNKHLPIPKYIVFLSGKIMMREGYGSRMSSADVEGVLKGTAVGSSSRRPNRNRIEGLAENLEGPPVLDKKGVN